MPEPSTPVELSPLDACVCGHERHAHCNACMSCPCDGFQEDPMPEPSTPRKRGKRGFRWSGPVKGWERDGWGGVQLIRKFTTSGVERKVRVWRFARWDFEVGLWRAG